MTLRPPRDKVPLASTGRSGRALLGLDAARGLALGGVVAAVVVAVVVNVLAARHYRRWDWTSGKLYTLTPATLVTLRDLSDPVEIWVMLGGGDPLEQSVKQLLVSYQSETTKLDVHYIDPDRDAVALEDVRKRFRIETGRTAEGRVVTDAIMVVARGERHWYLFSSDMFEVAADEARAKPREEQAITGAIRSVLGGERVQACFTTGHGELALSDGSKDGLGHLKDVLEKDNYEPVSIDTTEPNAHEPFKGCAVVVIAAPRGPFGKEEEARLRTYLMEGGSLFLASGPINAASENGMVPPGVSEALAPFGIALTDDLVFEVDPRFAIPESRGIRFVARAKTHPVTAALAEGDETRDPPHVVVQFSRSLRHAPSDGASVAADLLTSSEKSFGVTSIAGAAEWRDVPDKTAKDDAGPLVLAMASERPKVNSAAPHGPRVVVVGTGSVLAQRNWTEPAPARGAALLTESAISWLASKPQILDVPARPSVAAGMRITEESRSDVRRYVLVFMPLASVLLGIAVGLWRRSTERTPRKRRAPAKRKRDGAETNPDVEDEGT